MKAFFYIGLIGLALYEFVRVYFIMPMPGSQQWDSLAFAYAFHSYRWIIRGMMIVFILIGAKKAFSTKRKVVPIGLILFSLTIYFLFNFRLSAEKMFLEPSQLSFSTQESTTLADSSLVIAVSTAHEAKAYPIRYIAYHHQVRDELAGKEIMVTYCSVCRSGRVFEPLVKGRSEKFRLVGMDHFNAMFEDQTTGSWWQQANGEAIIGPLKGESLPELESTQLTLAKFFSLYPSGQVMAADPNSLHQYDSLGKYEFGLSQSKLTGTDSLSWTEKSWVIGIRLGDKSKAYDWNDLLANQIIHDKMGDVPLVIVLFRDQQSFKAYLREENTQIMKILEGDLLVAGKDTLDFHGTNVRFGEQVLVPLLAYQEFWHSWRTFNPTTEVYKNN
ncbi:DUF3179 domain-containing (seleno)protein [Pararhodonellum marinum]|uniref:DUF3179 domain-containing (seleno)protein n=1 Tax=Pararhodonellum marinum TaxID=2755358 RepID=UPI00188F77B8|nr:DUF3179 domain-containing (seleno)protein [Pararhodonellum marinum]